MESMASNTDAPKPKFKVMGEWSWEKYLFLLAGAGCFVQAVVESRWLVAVFVKNGTFHSALLFLALFYLSEMRYRLFYDLRNN